MIVYFQSEDRILSAKWSYTLRVTRKILQSEITFLKTSLVGNSARTIIRISVGNFDRQKFFIFLNRFNPKINGDLGILSRLDCSKTRINCKWPMLNTSLKSVFFSDISNGTKFWIVITGHYFMWIWPNMWLWRLWPLTWHDTPLSIRLISPFTMFAIYQLLDKLWNRIFEIEFTSIFDCESLNSLWAHQHRSKIDIRLRADSILWENRSDWKK